MFTLNYFAPNKPKVNFIDKLVAMRTSVDINNELDKMARGTSQLNE
jgi:phage antirepressor YoqD-like protein